MKRWLVILILLASCNGCTTFDDFVECQGPPPTQPTCGLRPTFVQQTAEPPR